jgi:hypothetical protein
MKRTISLGLLLAAVVVCGCRKSTTYTGPDGTKATVSKSGKNFEIKVEGKDGGTWKMAGGEGSVALPEGFPTDVPIYPGAKVATSVKTGDAMHATLQTSDAADKVSAFYKEKMKANGWELKTTMDMGQGTMLVGLKAGQSLNAMIARGDKGTTVSLTVTKEK